MFFFFNGASTTEIYTLSLHDALPIFHAIEARLYRGQRRLGALVALGNALAGLGVGLAMLLALWLAAGAWEAGDRKSTRLNSSHVRTSYAVFCLKKKIVSPTAGSRKSK